MANFENVHFTEIVEIPMLFKNGEVTFYSPELLRLSFSELELMAKMSGAEIGYVKFRATYNAPEIQLCLQRDCYRPVVNDKDWCEDHPH